MFEMAGRKSTCVALCCSSIMIFGPGAWAADSAVESVGLIPINDLLDGSYLGLYEGGLYEGGLYPGGTNDVPQFHAAEGTARMQQFGPIDTAGNPDPDGHYVLLSVGMSNTTQEFGQFLDDVINHSEVDLSRMVVVDGAASGQSASTWVSPNKANYDIIRDDLLIPNNLSEAQVQAVWLKVANGNPSVSLPHPNADAFLLASQMGDIARALAIRYPNLKTVFVSSRIYAGYATTTLNPEPFAYESGFAVKWLIEAQINQMMGLGIDPIAGDLDYNATAPWIAWGPYMWADGLSARNDGLIWECADLADDGTHPSILGRQKVSGMLIDFFLNSPFTKPWFRGENAGAAAIAVLAPNGGEMLDKSATQVLTWSSEGDAGATVLIRLLNGSQDLLLASSTLNDGVFEWSIPAWLPEKGGYSIEVASVDDPSIVDTSDDTFSLGN